MGYRKKRNNRRSYIDSQFGAQNKSLGLKLPKNLRLRQKMQNARCNHVYNNLAKNGTGPRIGETEEKTKFTVKQKD